MKTDREIFVLFAVIVIIGCIFVKSLYVRLLVIYRISIYNKLSQQPEEHMMDLTKSKKNYTNIIAYFPYLCVALFYFIDLCIFRILNRTHIESDMSSLALLARQLNKEGGLLSKNWYYETELRVINTHLLFRVALKLFPDNWSLARLLVQAVMLGMYAGILLIISKQLELGKTGVYITAALLCPVGYMYLWYVLFANFYLVHILFCLFALSLSIAFIKSNSIKKKTITVTLSLLCAFLSSINGIRYLMIYYLPFSAVSFAMLFMRFAGKGGTLSYLTLLKKITGRKIPAQV